MIQNDMGRELYKLNKIFLKNIKFVEDVQLVV